MTAAVDAEDGRPPVVDWATDFDHTDPGWVNDPYPIWDQLRQGCPVAHSARYGGTWLPVRHADVAAVAYDTEHFTSRSVVVSEIRPGPARPAGAHRPGPADHLRPAVPRPGPPVAAAGLRAQGDRRPRAADPRPVPGAARRHRRPRRVRRCRRLRPAHPAQGHHRHARLPPGGRRHLPAVHPHGPRGRQPVTGGASRADRHRRDRRLHRRPDRRPPGPSSRRPDQLPAGRRDRRQQACPRARARHHGAADDRRDRHHLVGDRVRPVAPGRPPRRPAPAGHRARS